MTTGDFAENKIDFCRFVKQKNKRYKMASVVNVKKNELKKNGYENFEEWRRNPQHIYIGRNMSFYVPFTHASKWQNPFRVKKHGLEECLRLYEEYVRKGPL